MSICLAKKAGLKNRCGGRPNGTSHVGIYEKGLLHEFSCGSPSFVSGRRSYITAGAFALRKKRGLKIAAADAPTERYVPYIGVTIEGDIFILP
ncbi:hypothetical protein HMPREF9555_01096 [Selenomonas artemidis F0399]|uniref:Uncharacterized protein n=1 Tax=Selenomonas artemidis F0399 TaxID=749551 RepID=E7N285_9FIRM|nr:hypothetical protein HMPREF9555_01096 [Selenomonas artemidis F0399]